VYHTLQIYTKKTGILKRAFNHLFIVLALDGAIRLNLNSKELFRSLICQRAKEPTPLPIREFLDLREIGKLGFKKTQIFFLKNLCLILRRHFTVRLISFFAIFFKRRQ